MSPTKEAEKAVIQWCREQIKAGAPEVVVSLAQTPAERKGEYETTQIVYSFEANGQKHLLSIQQVAEAGVQEFQRKHSQGSAVMIQQMQLRALVDFLRKERIPVKVKG